MGLGVYTGPANAKDATPKICHHVDELSQLASGDLSSVACGDYFSRDAERHASTLPVAVLELGPLSSCVESITNQHVESIALKQRCGYSRQKD